jgi:hypothetical protein
MRRLFSIGYFACWMAAAALLGYVLGVILWNIAGVSDRPGLDNLTLLGLPVGALLGVWAAARTRRAFLLHGVLGVGGALIAAWGAVKAAGFLEASEQATGVFGLFSGLPELFAAGLSIVAAVFGACLFGIWMFARLARF